MSDFLTQVREDAKVVKLRDGHESGILDVVFLMGREAEATPCGLSEYEAALIRATLKLAAERVREQGNGAHVSWNAPANFVAGLAEEAK